MKLTISANSVEEAIGQIVEWMRRGAESEESFAKTALLRREKRDYTARAAALRIYASMLSKIEVVPDASVNSEYPHPTETEIDMATLHYIGDVNAGMDIKSAIAKTLRWFLNQPRSKLRAGPWHHGQKV